MDGTKFILRIPGYQQKPDFARFAGEAVSEIAGVLPPKQNNSDHLLQLISEKIQKFRAEEIKRKTVGEPVFGKKVDHTKMRVRTKLMQRYEDFATEALLRIFGDEANDLKDLSASFYYATEAGESVERCSFRRVSGVPLLESPAGKVSPAKIKTAIDNFYSIAEDTSKARDQRRNAALKWYVLASCFCPFEAGSAMGVHWGLEILLMRQGSQLPHLKEGVDLNLQANTRSLDDFIGKIDSGEWFDFNAKPENILAWQATEIDFQKNNLREEFSTPEILARAVVRIRNGGPITTPKKALLKRMLENTDSRFPAAEIGRDSENGDAVFQVRFHNYKIDYLGLPEFFPDMRDSKWISTGRSVKSLNIWRDFVNQRKQEHTKQINEGRC